MGHPVYTGTRYTVYDTVNVWRRARGRKASAIMGSTLRRAAPEFSLSLSRVLSFRVVMPFIGVSARRVIYRRCLARSSPRGSGVAVGDDTRARPTHRHAAV